MIGRPRKTTVDYFPHYTDSRSSRTMFILENRWGNDGYSFWFKLLELTSRSENLTFRCGNTDNWEYLLGTTRVDAKTAEEILTTLANLDAIDKELWVECRVIWVTKLASNLGPIFEKRSTGIPAKPVLSAERTLSAPEKRVLVAEKPLSFARVVEESRVKENIVFPPISPTGGETQSKTSSSNIAIKLCEKFKSLIIENNPTTKVPTDLKTWALHIDRMLTLDKRTVQDIEAVMIFSQRDTFWAANILSTKKLREKFDQLYLKMRGVTNGRTRTDQLRPGQLPKKYESPEEFDARYNAERAANG